MLSTLFLKIILITSIISVIVSYFFLWLSYTEIFMKMIRFIYWFKFIMSIILTIFIFIFIFTI